MTGAGSGSCVCSPETSFLQAEAEPTFFEPGINPTIQELELQRALERQRQPQSVWSTQSIAQNLEGAFGVEFTMDQARQTDVHDIVLNDGGTALTSGLAATSRWYIGVEYIDDTSTATVERVAKGAAPIDYSVSYTQGGSIRVSITFIYADEEYNTSLTPSAINESSNDAAVFHGMDLSISGDVQVKEQSATLSLTNLSRFERGSSEVAVDAVVGPATATLDLTATISSTSNLELGYGGTGQNTTSKTMDDVSGSMELSAAGGTVATYELEQLKPDTVAWADVINDDASTSEQIAFNVDGENAVTVA